MFNIGLSAKAILGRGYHGLVLSAVKNTNRQLLLPLGRVVQQSDACFHSSLLKSEFIGIVSGAGQLYEPA